MARRVRITLDLSLRLNGKVEEWMRRHACTKAEAIRSALDVLFQSDRACSDGMHVGAWKDDLAANRRVERLFSFPGQ